MTIDNTHPSDQEMLLCADGELPSSRAARVHAHLAACWTCRARMAELEAGIREFLDVYQSGLDVSLPSAAGPRALLKAQLAQLAGEKRAAPRGRFFGFAIPVAVGMCTLVLALAVMHRAQDSIAVPRAGLTPGVALPITQERVCRMEWDQRVDLVPASLQQEVLQRYGLAHARPDAYEIDYLITPQLGGAGDVRNLWPEPYSNTVWNAHVKDALEDRLRDMVCQGALDLRTAQRDLATDWISAYKKYFHTNKPISR